MDLKYLMNHGEIDMDIADFKYQKMLFVALEGVEPASPSKTDISE
ncbi:hypothetical protein [Bacillus sp. FSL R12-0069]